MDTRRIRKLIELVKETGIGELEVKSGEDSVRISTTIQQPAPTVVVGTAAPVQPSVAAAPESAATAAEEPMADGFTQHSPMVGTVYLAAVPGAKPFVAVGDHVDEGDTLCLIEAMKMFNKIEAEKAGIVSARLIENEQPIEYDQGLFIIEPDES